MPRIVAPCMEYLDYPTFSIYMYGIFSNILEYYGIRIILSLFHIPYAPCMEDLPSVWAIFGLNISKCSIHGASGYSIWEQLVLDMKMLC